MAASTGRDEEVQMLLKALEASRLRITELEVEKAEITDRLANEKANSIQVTSTQRDLGVDQEAVRALTREVQLIKVQAALSYLHATTIKGPVPDSANVTNGYKDFNAWQPPLVWPAVHLDLWHASFAPNSIDVLCKQRHVSAHTCTPQQARAVIALGPFEEVTQDHLDLLQARFPDLCGVPFEQADESNIVFGDCGSRNKDLAAKKVAMGKADKQAAKDAAKQAERDAKHKANLARGEAAKAAKALASSSLSSS